MTIPANPAKMKLQDLTPAARAAVEQKTIGGGWDGRSLVKLMGELERWDKMAEIRKVRARKFFVGSIVACIAGFFCFFIIAFMVEEFLLGLTFLVVPALNLIVAFRMKKAARAIDLPNELRVSLRPVFRQLSQDLAPGEKIKVTMNLAGIDEGKCAEIKDLPPGRFRGLKQSTYEERLCSIRVPLTDGTHAILRMENTYLKLERRYTGRRGKTKSKTKWKKLATVTAMLIPPSRVVWEPARIEKLIDRANEKMSFLEKDGVMVARLDRYYKFKAAGDPPGDAVPAADILRMFVRLTAMRPQPAGGAR
jgi:hypothetical protein